MAPFSSLTRYISKISYTYDMNICLLLNACIFASFDIYCLDFEHKQENRWKLDILTDFPEKGRRNGFVEVLCWRVFIFWWLPIPQWTNFWRFSFGWWYLIFMSINIWPYIWWYLIFKLINIWPDIWLFEI